MTTLLHTTFGLLRKHKADPDSYKQAHKALYPVYGNEPIPLTAILDSNGLPDALWCLQAVLPEEQELATRLGRLLACDYAEHVAHLWVAPRGVTWQPGDTIAVARRYAWGRATANELGAAEARAWAAAAAWAAAEQRAAAAWAARAAAWSATA
ncbi:MAG: hypothetical protein HY532_08910, partial [Chloroflexi bacterium]|nr:hypothetical protein [Chloroflexota bacterium]